MPIPGYGVLRGKLLGMQRESEQGSPHYEMHLLAGETHFRVPVNVKSSLAPSELKFVIEENYKHPILAQMADLAETFTPLVSKPGSGALDFIRGNLFDPGQMRLLPPDLPGEDNDLQDLIEHYTQRAVQNEGAEVFVFGTRWGPEEIKDKVFGFTPGNGVHNIHMNQGNAPQFADDDGVWQDGGLFFHYPSQEQWVAIFLAFQSQAWHTDDITGHALEQVMELDHIVRIVGALVNPVGTEPEQEKVILLNTSPNPVDLNGWAIADKTKNKFCLSGALEAGSAASLLLGSPVHLSNKGGIITLLDPQGLKVDGVSYTAEQGKKEGWVIKF